MVMTLLNLFNPLNLFNIYLINVNRFEIFNLTAKSSLIFLQVAESETQQLHFLHKLWKFLLDELFSPQCENLVFGVGRHEVAHATLVVDNLDLLEEIESPHHCVGVHAELYGDIADTRYAFLSLSFVADNSLT